MTVNLKRLKAERIASGMTQDEVAHRMGWKTRTPYAKRETELFLLALMNWPKSL